MILAATGHRPEKLGNDPGQLLYWAAEFIKEAKPAFFITGMAAGWDLMTGKLALEMNIPIICAIPWRGHRARREDREIYDRLIAEAAHVAYVTDVEPYPGPWVYHLRNRWMVDNSHHLIAAYDGSAGGTSACLEYARKVEREYTCIDPNTYAVSMHYRVSCEECDAEAAFAAERA